MKYKAGQKVIAIAPPSIGKVIKCYIEVVHLGYYNDNLLVYRAFCKSKRVWKYYMCYDYEMDNYINRAKNL